MSETTTSAPAVRPSGGRADSAPLLGRATEPTIFELSEPGRTSWQLRTTGIPETALEDLVPALHRPERGDRFPMRQIAERQTAAFAARVFETQRLAAILALEELHCFFRFRRGRQPGSMASFMASRIA